MQETVNDRLRRLLLDVIAKADDLGAVTKLLEYNSRACCEPQLVEACSELRQYSGEKALRETVTNLLAAIPVPAPVEPYLGCASAFQWQPEPFNTALSEAFAPVVETPAEPPPQPEPEASVEEAPAPQVEAPAVEPESEPVVEEVKPVFKRPIHHGKKHK